MIGVNSILKGRYKLLNVLGHGSYGTVYKALALQTNQLVAVKVLKQEQTSDERRVSRFRREAQSVRGLATDIIVKVLDSDEEDGQFFNVYELVEGQTLRQILDQKKVLPVEQALQFTTQILRGLDVAHQAGVIHRDLKPSNIMITPNGQVKIMDFGIAKDLNMPALTTELYDQALGTPSYISPEQAQGGQMDYRTDIYSVGVMLFEMLSGRVPFIADSNLSLLLKHINEQPPPLYNLNSNVTPQLDGIVRTAMAKWPDSRYYSAEQFANVLTHYINNTSKPGQAPLAAPQGGWAHWGGGEGTASTFAAPPRISPVPTPPPDNKPPVLPEQFPTMPINRPVQPPVQAGPPPGARLTPPVPGPVGRPPASGPLQGVAAGTPAGAVRPATPPNIPLTQTPPKTPTPGKIKLPEKAPPYELKMKGIPLWAIIAAGVAVLAIVIFIVVMIVSNGNKPDQLAQVSPAATQATTTAPAVTQDGTVTPALSNTPTPDTTGSTAGSGTSAAPSPTIPPITIPAIGAEDVLYQQGIGFIDSKNWKLAVAAFELLKTRNYRPDDVKGYLSKAYCGNGLDLAPSGDYSEAKIMLDNCLVANPGNADAKAAQQLVSLYRDGRIFADQKNWVAAIPPLEQLYGLKADYRDTQPLLFDVYLQYIGVLRSQRQFPDAITVCNKAKGIDSGKGPVQAVSVCQQIQADMLALTPSPTPRPSATPTPVKKCSSNFFAYNIGQPSVPNVADRGSSSVSGRVINKGGSPVSGATIRATAAGFSFTTSTNGSGYYRIDGLGRGHWEVVVLSAPYYTICTSLSGGINLSGEPGFVGTVDFVESVP